jgi:hypothetical protein
MPNTKPLRVHSVVEAYLYLMVQRCAGCGQGPVVNQLRISDCGLRNENDLKIEMSETTPMAVRCKGCGAESVVELDLRDALEERPRLWNEIPIGEAGGVAVAINATAEPSAVIDVAQWLTLSSVIADAARVFEAQAETAADRGIVRQLNVQAGRCLDEAIKFYLDGEELPPRKAFFEEGSRQQFRERPEFFARTRVVGMRGKFPVVK